MGAWWYGVFDNDDAADFAAKFNDEYCFRHYSKVMTFTDVVNKIGGALLTGILNDKMDQKLTSEALICCEVIAAICGNPNNNVGYSSSDVVSWAITHKEQLTNKLLSVVKLFLTIAIENTPFNWNSEESRIGHKKELNNLFNRIFR